MEEAKVFLAHWVLLLQGNPMGPLEVLMQKAVFRPYIFKGLTDERGWKKLLGSWHQFPAP